MWSRWVEIPPVAPASARAVLFLGSTRTVRIGDMSITKPPSLVPNPGALCPPSRTERSNPFSRAKLTPAITSATCSARSTASGRLSNMPLCTRPRLTVIIVGRGDHTATHLLTQGLDTSPGARTLRSLCRRHASSIDLPHGDPPKGCDFVTDDASAEERTAATPVSRSHPSPTTDRRQPHLVALPLDHEPAAPLEPTGRWQGRADHRRARCVAATPPPASPLRRRARPTRGSSRPGPSSRRRRA